MRMDYIQRAGLALAVGLLLAAPASAQKHGGELRATLRGAPAELSIHETALSVVTHPMTQVYNNLVTFDVFQPRDTPETIIADLAESWEWRNNHTELALKLRRGVTWHDGKPFTSKDVKHTFDLVRGATRGGLKLNPRKTWYFNVKDIVTRGDHEVSFMLHRPQSSLLPMLATGYSPVYPAHVPPAQLRIKGMGTGPFMMTKYEPDQYILMVKNPKYFVKDRPYLDAIRWVILKSQPTEMGALLGKQVDVAAILATPQPVKNTLEAADAGLVFKRTVTNATINIIFNTKKPPFNNVRLRRAVNLAMERDTIIKSVFQSGAERGSAMIPAPWGVWGMTKEQLSHLPGYGDPEANKAEARKILAELGYTAEKPFRMKVTHRAVISSTASATWALGELKAVGIAAELRPIETGTWYGMVARRDFEFAINETAVAIDDPDAAFYENYKCGSQRNYTDFCDPEMEKAYDAQSTEIDFKKRLKMVQAIDVKLQELGARPYLAYRVDYYAHYPYVKNWIPHQSIYNGWRMDQVWLDK